MQQDFPQIDNAAADPKITTALLNELSRIYKEAEEAKKREKEMIDFLKKRVLLTIKRKLNAFLTRNLWNKFLIYETCFAPSWCFDVLVKELPKYNPPTGSSKLRGVDQKKMYVIESKDVFQSFFGVDADSLKRKYMNGGHICFFLPIIIMYRPGLSKVMIGMKKAPKTKTGQIGRLVKYEFKPKITKK